MFQKHVLLAQPEEVNGVERNQQLTGQIEETLSTGVPFAPRIHPWIRLASLPYRRLPLASWRLYASQITSIDSFLSASVIRFMAFCE